MEEDLNEEQRSATVYLRHLPQAANRRIGDIYLDIKDETPRLTLKPLYQRSFCWSNTQREYLIRTIMDGCPMPLFLLYQDGDVYECIDGQNRLNTIKEFKTQVYTEDHEFDDAIAWKGLHGGLSCAGAGGGGSEEMCYFYPPEEEIKKVEMQQWMTRQNELPRNKQRKRVRKFQYMEAKDIRRFDNYQLQVVTLDTELSPDARREIFMRWQHGSPTSVCDSFRNKRLPFCQFLHTFNVENRIFAKKLEIMMKMSKSEWLWDIYRLLSVFCDGPGIQRFLIARNHCRQVIVDGIHRQQWPDALEKCCHFVDVIVQLKKCEGLMHISDVLILADQWNTDPAPFDDPAFETRILSALRNKDIMHCSLITPITVGKFAAKYNIAKAIMFYIPPTASSPPRQHIPNQRKTEVWNHYVGEEIGVTLCLCCHIVEITSRNFITGHIVPDVKGGTIDVSNLLPICAGCNSSMGTMNMDEYKLKMNYK